MLQATRMLPFPGSKTAIRRFAGTVSGAGKIFRVNRIGNREVVGFGMNGTPSYIDNPAFPFPAVKFRELTPEYKALEEKAKGDWKKLSLAEKKQLYRINYCQTFAEMTAPTGEWKSIIGWGLIMVSLAVWLHLFIEYVKSDFVPVITMSEERRKAQLRRMIDLAVDPIDGLASKWDYEKNMWKKDVRKCKKKSKDDQKREEKREESEENI